MLLRRLFSVGSAALVLTGALLAHQLAPQRFFPGLTPNVQAQSQGNASIGPNDAQVRPAVGDKVAGLPMVVLLQASQSQTWADSLRNYGSATPLVIRITEVDVNSTGRDWAQVGRDLAATLSQIGKTGSIVVFGNELNNLDREWKSFPTPPAAGDPAIPGEMQAAAQSYAVMYRNFESGLGSAGQLAPAPPDVANPVYDWQIWVQAIPDIYRTSPALVMNVYQQPSADPNVDTISTQIFVFETITGNTVDFLTEIGIDPNNKNLVEHLEFLNTYRPSVPAATLVPNHCRSGGWGNGSNVDDWLFYVRGVLYDKEGNTVEASSCGVNTQPAPTGNPVFLYPDPALPQATFQQELDMYLANSQAYCAPAQVFWPTRPEQGDPLIPCQPGERATWITDSRAVCMPEDYPPVDVDEEVNLTSFSFPLFRSDAGGISIESDLSRVKPGETLADALQRNARPDAAPQFFLSSPQTQCTSAVRYLEYARALCEQDGATSPEALKECGANLSVRLADGSTKQILDFQAVELPNEAACQNYSSEDINQNTPRAIAVQAITPFTPKVYKMGFYVQHTKLTGSNAAGNANFWHTAQRIIFGSEGASALVGWFRGQEPDYPEPQERIDVVPVWYHAGLTASQYDSNQLRPYAFDLREYSMNGTIEAKNFDPEEVRKSTLAAENSPSRNIFSRMSSTAIPQTDETNYAGPLWQTYAFVLPTHVQDTIATRRLQVTFQNYFLLQFMRNQFFGQGKNLTRDQLIQGVGSDVVTQLRLNQEWFWKQPTEAFVLPFECKLLGGGPDDPGYKTCATFRQFAYDETAPSPKQPLAQTYEEIAAAFPHPIALPANQSNLDLLKQSIIARINAGVQSTVAYQPTQENEQPSGPLSVRQLGYDMCNVDQANLRQGEQNSAESITSNAIQPLDKTGAEPTDPPRTAIGQLVNQLRFWVYGGPHPSDGDGTKFITDRVTRAYLILPDEALTIETLQAYTAPLFLSPEMYGNIVRGENDIYPFAEKWQQMLAAADEGDRGHAIKLSPFLRTLGPERALAAQEEGFIKAQGVQQEIILTGCPEGPAGVGVCGCGNDIRMDAEVWMTLSDFEARQRPSTANGCYGFVERERRTVNVEGQQPGKNPDAGVNVPGNLLALGEYLRRLAFTPAHMQKDAKYTGLEDFYAQNQQSAGTGTTPNQCAYLPAKEYDIRDQGYTAASTLNESFRGDICSAASQYGIDGSLVRSLLAIEGGAFLNAMVGRGNGSTSTKYVCEPNSSGAIGPMQRVVGQCSSRPISQGLFLQDNTKTPDLCTLAGSMPATGRHLREIAAVVSSQSSAAPGSAEYYERMAERYLGTGSCGAIGVPGDGEGKAMPTEEASCQFTYNGQTVPCNQVDYCAFVADRATEEYANYCGG